MYVVPERQFDLAFAVLEGMGNLGDLSKFIGGFEMEQIHEAMKNSEKTWRAIESSEEDNNFFVQPRIQQCVSGGYLAHILEKKSPSYFDYSPYLHWKFRHYSNLFGGFYVVRGKLPTMQGGGHRGFLALVGSSAGLGEFAGLVRELYLTEKIKGGFYLDLIYCLEGL